LDNAISGYAVLFHCLSSLNRFTRLQAGVRISHLSLQRTYVFQVDSFCIIQNDDEHKREQIDAMDSIYGHSLFTIIAISGIDANAGLPGVRPNTRPLRYISIDEGHALVGTTDQLGSIMRISTYETRGWTFQERLLSPRCLYVSDWQYFFSCLTETCCEDGLSEKPLEEEFDPHHVSPNCLVRKLADLGGRMPAQMAFSIYAEIIEDFSARSLTSPFDTVNAIAGINAVAVGSLGGFLCCGGPGALIEHCLLWIPKASHQPIRNKYFPSWSWAGWICPVNFRLAMDVFKVTINSIMSCRADISMVEGMAPLRYIDILEIKAWACNAQQFRSWLGLIVKCETGPLGDTGDSRGEVVGMFFDTEIPDEPRRSSCWILALFMAMKQNITTKPTAEAGHLGASDPDLNSRGDEWQVIVMLVEDKGDHVERVGIGITSVDVWLPIFDSARKEFILK
jgi:Heterokaryon incompatibility protein (HET)